MYKCYTNVLCLLGPNSLRDGNDNNDDNNMMIIVVIGLIIFGTGSWAVLWIGHHIHENIWLVLEMIFIYLWLYWPQIQSEKNVSRFCKVTLMYSNTC